MRAIFGLLLVMLGLAMAVLWMPEHNGERQLAAITDVATKGIPLTRDRSTPGDSRTSRSFSPSMPLLASVEPATAKAHAAVVGRPILQPGDATAAVPSGVQSAAVLWGPAPRQAEASTQPAPQAEMKRDELVRNIQRELKRVSCYAGDIDGDWGAGSKRAMAAFTDHVNASLPVDQPDIILFTLLRGHSGVACGAGRSVAPVIAQLPPRTADKSQPLRSSTQVAAAPRPQSSGQGAWAATVQRPDGITAVPLVQAPPPRAVVGQTPQQSAPAQITTAQVVPAAAAALPTAAPLPGRMAMGGPVGSLTAPAPSLTQPAAVEPPLSASGARRTAKRTSRRSPGTVAYRLPVPAVGIYVPVVRATPARYYAAAPRRGRSWTGTFFGTP